MYGIQGKNEIVKELIARSEEKSTSMWMWILSFFALAWAWYTTRPENTKDIIRGIPVAIAACFLFFFLCFL